MKNEYLLDKLGRCVCGGGGRGMSHFIDSSCCKNRGCNKCDAYRKELEKIRGTAESVKPIEIKIKRSFSGNELYREGFCGACRGEIVNKLNYCHRCGARIGSWEID